MNVNDKKLVELPLECPDEVWRWLLKDAERFAAAQIAQYRWRGAKRGVLPGGFAPIMLFWEKSALCEVFTAAFVPGFPSRRTWPGG